MNADVDPRVAAATELLGSIKAKDGRFREMPELAISCDNCAGQRRTIARFFVGRDDDGVVRVWMLAQGMRFDQTQKSVWRAQPTIDHGPVVEPGTEVETLAAICVRCEQGWLLFPAALSPEMQERRESGQLPLWVVALEGSGPAKAGVRSVTYELSEWVDGPGSIVRARVVKAKRGRIQP